MTALADTRAFLWWNLDDPRLSDAARDVLKDPRNTIYISSAVGWEIAIKVSTGNLPLPDPPLTFVPARIHEHGFTPLAITMQHALSVSLLPPHHRDPFDRIQIAQSQVEQIPIITGDPLIT